MDPPFELPEKLYFKIGEVARLLEVAPHVLRYWEEEFPMLRPHKSRGGQRLYRRTDVEVLLRIKSLLRDQKFTIAGARRQLAQELRAGKREPKQPAPGPKPEELTALRRELEQLEASHQDLARANVKTSHRLEAQRQVLREVRKEIADLLEVVGKPGR